MRGLLSYTVTLLLFFTACTDKSVDLEIEQEACKRFKISSPGYQRIEDPCQGALKIVAEVSFQYNRSADCLHQVNNRPVFYRRNNSELLAESFSATVARNDLNIGDDIVTYRFEATFVDAATAQELNHLVLDFNTENELGVKSNTLQIRINTSCSTVDLSSYEVNDSSVSIPPSQNFFTIRLWDNAAEDGDIVSVYLNGQWIIENHSLLKAGTNFTFSTDSLNRGANDLVVFALNEGTSGPNTVSIAINGREIPNFKPGLLTGEAVRIDF
ncbi:MAG: hypothetical protein RIC95_13870 [Vicingaceae bacterium]